MDEDTEKKEVKENENEVEEEGDDLFGLWIWIIFAMFMVIGGVLFLVIDEWWPPAIALALGIFWVILSFRIVQPAFAGLVLRFGSRVKIDEDYLIKGEGWTFVFPIVERIVQISLRQQQEEINSQRLGETEDAYKNRAESFSTAEGVNIFPEIFFSYKIVNSGKVFELGVGVDENGNSPFLSEMLHNLVMGGTRGVLAKMELTKILSRETQDENGNAVSIGEKILDEITKTPAYEGLGAEILILRIEDIKFKQDAQDVLNALEGIKKKELERQFQIVEADTKLEVQKRASETLINKSGAELTDARNKALAKNADIAAFVGKKLEEPTTTEDGKAYAQYQIGLEVAKSLGSGTKVIIPAGDVSKVMAGLVNVFEAAKP